MADTGAGPSQERRKLNEKHLKAKRESERQWANPSQSRTGFQQMETTTGL